MKKTKTIYEMIHSFGDLGKNRALTFFQKKGKSDYTYQQLFQDVRALSDEIHKKGFAKGDRIALFSTNNYEWITAALAIIYAGAVLVPIDIQSEENTFVHIIKDSGAGMIFVTSDRQKQLQKYDIDIKYFLTDKIQYAEGKAAGSANPDIQPEDTAILFYTSGTTGMPKGVPLTHQNISFQIDTVKNAQLLHEQETLLLPLPLHHVYPLVIGLFAPLSMGQCILFPQALTGPQIMRGLKEGKATVIIGVPRLYRALLESIESRIASAGRMKRWAFGMILLWKRVLLASGKNPGKLFLSRLHKEIGPDLRLLASGGSALSPELHEKLCAIGWQVGIGYGLTETAPLLTVQHPEEHHPGSVGKAVEQVELRLSTVEGRQIAEIQARGPNVFGGYWNQEKETHASFTKDGWFKTGDTGYMKDKRLYLTGRASTLIITESGENIQPDEIEDVLSQDPLVKEAGVLQKENKLVGIIVPEKKVLRKKEAEPLDEVWRTVNQRIQGLPTYKRLDEFHIFQESLPRTRLGKIRRHLLPEIYEKAKSQKTGQKDAGHPVSPQEMSSEDQDILENPDARTVWDWLSEKYSDRRLTPDTSPQLELGIDSMEWINMSLEIRRRVDKKMSEEAIARINTVRDLLKEVIEHEPSTTEEGERDWFVEPESKISDDQKKWLKARSPCQQLLGKCVIIVNRMLVRIFFRVCACGLENLPSQGPFIITANHVSFLDPFVLGSVLDKRQLDNTYWTGWTGVAFHNAFVRGFSRLAKVVPVNPQKGAASSLAFVLAVLKRGQNIVIFPEGQRSHNNQLQTFKPGLGLVLNHVEVPVIPVIIDGTFEAWPVKRFFPRPHAVKLTFGEPLSIEDLKKDAGHSKEPSDLMHSLHNIMRTLKKETAT
jgi:long-chain acyl-CoA synthetase